MSPLYAALPTFNSDNYAWSQDHWLSMQQRCSCRVSLHVISTTATLCSGASQTLCSGASSRCRTRQHDSSPALVVVTTSHQCWGNSTGFLLNNESISRRPSWSTRRCTIQLQRILSTTASSSHTPAVADYDRPTSTRALCHGPPRGSATGVSQSLDHGSEQSAGQDSPARQRHWRISSAAKVVFVSVTLQRIVTSCFYVPRKYSYLLTHSLTHSQADFLVLHSYYIDMSNHGYSLNNLCGVVI